MKLSVIGHIAKAALFAAALLAAGLLGKQAKAQARFQGRFTLPFETRWGQAVLPAGEYELRFAPSDSPAVLVIRDVKSRRPVAYESIPGPDDAKTGPSALVIGTKGTQRVVYSLRIAELGETFVYERSPAHLSKNEEARQLQTVPVLAAER